MLRVTGATQAERRPKSAHVPFPLPTWAACHRVLGGPCQCGRRGVLVFGEQCQSQLRSPAWFTCATAWGHSWERSLCCLQETKFREGKWVVENCQHWQVQHWQIQASPLRIPKSPPVTSSRPRQRLFATKAKQVPWSRKGRVVHQETCPPVAPCRLSSQALNGSQPLDPGLKMGSWEHGGQRKVPVIPHHPPTLLCAGQVGS